MKQVDHTLPFEQRTPYGWHTVAFPKVHQASVNLDLWFTEVHEWMRRETAGPYFSCFTPCTDKKRKAENLSSPLLFFKELMDAKRTEWRFNGELL